MSDDKKVSAIEKTIKKRRPFLAGCRAVDRRLAHLGGCISLDEAGADARVTIRMAIWKCAVDITKVLDARPFGVDIGRQIAFLDMLDQASACAVQSLELPLTYFEATDEEFSAMPKLVKIDLTAEPVFKVPATRVVAPCKRDAPGPCCVDSVPMGAQPNSPSYSPTDEVPASQARD